MKGILDDDPRRLLGIIADRAVLLEDINEVPRDGVLDEALECTLLDSVA